MRFTKKELIDFLDDEEDDCILVFELDNKEIIISKMECCSDNIVYLKMKTR